MRVPPCGPTDHPLLAIVGEAPGQEEARLGVPFVGASGQLLNSMLQAAGIDRNSCYITNVVKEQPPRNDFASLYYNDPHKRANPSDTLVTLWNDLRAELRAVNPRVIIALGGEALRALTDQKSIGNFRGTMCEVNSFRVVPTLHPAFLLRGNYQDRAIVETDLRKALRQALNPSRPRVSFITDPSFEECLHYLRQPHDCIAYDLETTGNLTRLFGFAWSEGEAISIPFMRGHTHRWTEEQEIELWQAVANMLANPAIRKRVQNGMYDDTILAREAGVQVVGLEHDTMLAQHLLYPELPKGLDFISSVYTDHPMYWGEGTNPLYNCYDCVVTWDAGEQQKRELQDRNMWEFFQSGPMRTLKALLYVQSQGVRVDMEARAKLRVEESAKLEQYKRDLATNGFPYNPLSSKKVMDYLYDELKLPVQYKGFGPTKKRTGDDDAIRALITKFPHFKPVLQGILDCRQTNTLISTFIDQELKNGRNYTSYNVAGTVTGRLSSSTTIDGLGGNMQNFPRGDFRRILCAD